MKYEQPTQAPQAPEIAIYYKTTADTSFKPEIHHANDIYNIMFAVGEMNKNLEYKEMFYAIYLNNACRVLAVHKISEGTTTAAPVDLKFILQGAIMTNAAALVVCHNHPSGKLTPSTADRTLTEKIRKAANLFDIRLLDSLIMTTTNYYSFAEEGII